MTNYIPPEDMNGFFKQFLFTDGKIHLFIVDQKIRQKIGVVVFGRACYGSCAHNYKKLAEVNGFETQNWKIWPSKQAGGSRVRIFAYFTRFQTKH